MKSIELDTAKIYLRETVSLVRDFVDVLLNVKIEILLVFFSGLLSLLTAATCYRSAHLYDVRLVAVGNGSQDVIAHSCFLLVVLGLLSFGLTLTKLTRRFNMNFNKFLLMIVVLLLINFGVALILSEYKETVISEVDVGMSEQLKRSVLLRRLSLSAHSQPSTRQTSREVVQAWDTIQMKLSCCGVNSYRDYIPLYPEKTKLDKVIPMSCCSVKNLASLGKLESFGQCYIDASIDAVSSQFLHTQGCQGALQRWLVHLINKVMYLIYVTACFQGSTIIYLSYLGYKDVLKM